MADEGESSREKHEEKDSLNTEENSGKEEKDDAISERENAEDEGVDVSDGDVMPKLTTNRKNLPENVEDFQVRVKIHQGRQLAIANARPVVRITCGPNQIKITRVKKGSAPLWEQLLVFNFKVSLKELYSYSLEFFVNNSQTLRSDSLIGHFKLDLGKVYDQQGHAHVRKWLLLTDPEDSSNTPKGYLKVTMYVLGAGDEPPIDSGKVEDDDDDVEGNLLRPAGANLLSVQFILRALQAEDLPQMDTAAFRSMKKLIGIGKSSGEEEAKLVDSYLAFKFAGKERKTRFIEQNAGPAWYEELTIPFKFPSVADTLKLTLYDWDRIGFDDVIGTVQIPLSNISSAGEASNSGFLPSFGPTFLNIYGSPREFSLLSSSLEPMNHGKFVGCAYRGRVMVELKTELSKKETEVSKDAQPMKDGQIAVSQRYLCRTKYRLAVVLQEATMMKQTDDPIEFEVSMGNYGNKFEDETQTSTTEPTQPVYGGTRYYYLPWGSRKPVVTLSSRWEDISFRYDSLNVLLRLISVMENNIKRVKGMMSDEREEIEIALEIVEIFNELLRACSKGVPDPRGNALANTLDSRLHARRTKLFALIGAEAEKIRQTCTDPTVAITALEDFIERLREVAHEPQDSMPDVVLWMLSDNKRVAYIRIPAYDVLYSKGMEQYCGRLCGSMQNIFMKYPSAEARSKKHYKIACQLRAMIWLGKASDEDSFEFNSRGKISLYADTFETEIRVPIKGWTSDGYKDSSNNDSLPKDTFTCPPGWRWEQDWYIHASAQHSDPSAAALDVYTEEVHEVQRRHSGGPWEDVGFLDEKLEPIPGLNAVVIVDGWAWIGEWEIDSGRVGDDHGWEYTISMKELNPVWKTVEKAFHLNRRRRWTRTRKCVNAKVRAKHERELMALRECWEYATTGWSTYHPKPKTLDLVRRRRWTRRMVADDSNISTAIFGLDDDEEPPEDDDTDLSHSTEETGERADRKSESGTTEERKEGSSFGASFRASFFKTKKKETHSSSESKKRSVLRTSRPRLFLSFERAIKLQLRVYLYQGRDLLCLDEDSYSDPFVYASFLNQCKRSEIIYDSLNPMWDQALIMDFEFFGDLIHLCTCCPDVMLEIFDKDNIGGLEFLGQTSLQPMIKLDSEEPTLPRLAWFDVTRGKVKCGSILAAAELIVKADGKKIPCLPPKKSNVYKVPPGIRPELQRTAMEIVIWGVRNMEPYNLLSVNQPSVVVEIGDVEVCSEVIKSLRKFPNFSKPVFYLEANLPKEKVYNPPIVIRVRDNREFGRRPIVGEYTITDISRHIVPAPPVIGQIVQEEDEGIEDVQTVIEITPLSLAPDDGQGPSGLAGQARPIQDSASNGEEEPLPESQLQQDVEIEIYEPEASEEYEDEELEDEKKPKLMSKFFVAGLLATLAGADDEDEEETRGEDFDWWSKYYASVSDAEKPGQYLETGMDKMKVYKGELEKQKLFEEFSDFIQNFPLTRRMNNDEGDEDDVPQITGALKGAISMYPLPSDPSDPMPERIYKNVPSTDAVEVKVRVYVVRAFDLAPHDTNGLADPYLKIEAGKKRIDDKDNHLTNTLNPTFGRMFELDLVLPMEKDLRIEVIDWDLIGANDKIGETVIDLENRFLSKHRAWCGLPASYCCQGINKWRGQMTPKDWLVFKAREMNMDEPVWNGNTALLFNKKKYLLETFEKNKKACKDWGPADQRLALHVLRTFPHVTEHVETRPLFTDVLPGMEQGRLQLWVDMFPKHFGEPADPFDITPRKASKYYVRVVVWNCRDIPLMDTSVLGDKMSDIYIKGWIEGLENMQQKTDVHYRSLDGTGMFNWRFVFPLDYIPQERVHVLSKREHVWSLNTTTTKVPPTLCIQVWDNDLLSSNDFISEIKIPLTRTPKCTRSQAHADLGNIPDLQGNCAVPIINMFDHKMLNGWWPLYMVEDGVRVQAGKIEMCIDVVTEEENEQRPAARARDEPNQNPALEKPKRPATSFAWFTSPWKSFRYIIWRKYGCTVVVILLLILLIIFIGLFIYTFPSNFTQWALQKT